MFTIQLLPHQYKTIEYIENKCSNQKGLLLWHHMGTGKTISGLAWIAHITLNYSGNYLIICPPLIKSQWLITAKKMNINLKKSSLIDYDTFQHMINTKSKNIKNKYLIFDECHKLCDIIFKSINEDMLYSEINEYLTLGKKILLLSGTPFRNMMDYAIIINICANDLIMPITHTKLIEKYGDKSIFEKNKQNPMLFNLIKPLLKKLEGNILNNTIIPYIQNRGVSFRNVLESIFIIPLMIAIKPYINSNMQYVHNKLIDIEEHFYSSNVIAQVQKIFGNDSTSSIKKLLNFGINSTKLPDVDDHNSDVIHILKKVSKWILTFVILYIVNMIWDEFRTFVSYRFVNIQHLNNIPLKYDSIITDTQRYISYYKYKNDVDYASINPNIKTFRSILSFNTIMITVLFFYGKVELELLSFITGRNVKELTIDTQLVLTNKGYDIYGRVLSNLPEFVYDMIKIPREKLYTIDNTTGAISINGMSKTIIKNHSSSKFVKLGDWLSRAKKPLKHKVVIYSDYVEQGACLLSAYFTARGIKHVYLSNMLSIDKQTTLLKRFNETFENKIIILDKNSSEGISLLNIKELHFLEPSINPSVKNQVIGRAVRFQSHKDLKENNRIVDLYIHSSSIFQEEKEKLTFLQKLKTMKIVDILLEPFVDLKNSTGDNQKIDKILHEQKFKYFKYELQTTFNYKLDEYLGLNIKDTVQGNPIRSYRKNINIPGDDDNDNNDEYNVQNHKKKLIVLSIDELCEYEYRHRRLNKIEQLIKTESVIENNYKILQEHKCRKSSKLIKTQFGRKKTIKKQQ